MMKVMVDEGLMDRHSWAHRGFQSCESLDLSMEEAEKTGLDIDRCAARVYAKSPLCLPLFHGHHPACLER